MIYQTFEPSSSLSSFIKCYWTLDSEAGEETLEKQTIVPDGCMEMIFHHGEYYQQLTLDEGWITQPKCFVFGQLTRPLEIMPTGKTGIFSVRFHPNGFLPFASMPIKDMENKAVALESIFGQEVLHLEEKMMLAESAEERITLVENFLLEKLTDEHTIHKIIHSTIETMMEAKGRLPVDEVAKMVKINKRQLERKFSEAIGLSPKQLSKTIRLQETIKNMYSKKYSNLTELAYQGAFFDQAHFIKDFKELTGMTPKEFYSNSLEMTMHFFSKE